jgi:predicted nuclease of predicted toxin-antitoxin system
MRFLLDAQLPRRLVHRIRDAGHDALHTLDLPAGNRTSDAEIIAFAEREQRVVVTKDADFVASFWVTRQPSKLLLISTGNITNTELEALLIPQLPALIDAFAAHDFVELARTTMLIHD